MALPWRAAVRTASRLGVALPGRAQHVAIAFPMRTQYVSNTWPARRQRWLHSARLLRADSADGPDDGAEPGPEPKNQWIERLGEAGKEAKRIAEGMSSAFNRTGDWLENLQAIFSQAFAWFQDVEKRTAGLEKNINKQTQDITKAQEEIEANSNLLQEHTDTIDSNSKATKELDAQLKSMEASYQAFHDDFQKTRESFEKTREQFAIWKWVSMILAAAVGIALNDYYSSRRQPSPVTLVENEDG